ncbi:hypothetical protein E2C01_096142 [Portunus trituberculatus]|uniref:Uncharacterized protein n=1 Tax=Portunus trituberculatus TaxID=210409 RepID=A0A5B7K209_PORTR|nr:hypothetical protein [Portunus trituberculatus]
MRSHLNPVRNTLALRHMQRSRHPAAP